MYKKLFSDTVIYGLGAILPRLIIFALTRLYILHLDNTEYAKFSQLYSAIAFLNVILTFGFETAFFRYASEENLYKRVFNTSFWFMFANASIFLVLLYLFQIPIAEFANYSDHPDYLMWFGWIAFFDTICVIPFAVLRFKGRPIMYSGIRIVQNLFQVGLTFYLFLYASPSFLSNYLGLNEKVTYPFFANFAGAALGVLLLFNVIKDVRFQFDKALFKKMFHYGYPIMLAGLAFMLNENLDKLVQRNIISEADAGSYSGCYKLAMIMTLFVTAYRMGIEPFLFKVAKNADSRKTYADILFYFSLICNVIILGILANLSWITAFFIPNESYRTAMDIVPIILVANLFYALYYNLSTWYKVTDQTYVGTVISLIGGGITILMNVLLLREYGFMVSAWATFIAYATMMIISYIWGQKKYKIPYKTPAIIGYMVLAIFLSFLQYYVFKSNLVIGNLLLFSYLGFLFFTQKSTIKLLLKK